MLLANIDIGDYACIPLKYMARKGKVARKTKETSISVEVNIDGKGNIKLILELVF